MVDLDEWRNKTSELINFHLDHREYKMAARLLIIAIRELILDQQKAELDRRRAIWRRDADNFNAMCELKADIREFNNGTR